MVKREQKKPPNYTENTVVTKKINGVSMRLFNAVSLFNSLRLFLGNIILLLL